jgi:hypothetical protein
MARYLAQRVLPTHSLAQPWARNPFKINVRTLVVMSSSSAKRKRRLIASVEVNDCESNVCMLFVGDGEHMHCLKRQRRAVIVVNSYFEADAIAGHLKQDPFLP